MRSMALAFLSVALFLFVMIQRMAAAPQNGSCGLPVDLAKEVAQKYPGTHLLSFQDLSEDDRQIFKANHPSQCPGLVSVNFYGDGKPTLALVLAGGPKSSPKATLVVAHQLGGRWHTRVLEKTEGTPVVWREDPGKYEDVYGKKTIKASRPVIVFAGLESWAVVYVWMDERVEKVQVAD